MNRRNFLAICAVTVPAAAITFSPLAARLPVELKAMGKIFRGAAEGTVLVSEDDGNTWATHTRFGAGFEVSGLSLDRQGRVAARLTYLGHPFQVYLSTTGGPWRTV